MRFVINETLNRFTNGTEGGWIVRITVTVLIFPAKKRREGKEKTRRKAGFFESDGL